MSAPRAPRPPAAEVWRANAARWMAEGLGWADLPGDALAWTIAGVFADRGVALITDEADSAERLARGLRFFLADPGRVELFPGDDVKPWDGFSPSPEIPGQRARVLYRLKKGDPIIVVAPVRALLQRIPAAAERARATLELRPGQQLDRDALVRELSNNGYLAVGMVTQDGCFAVRGDVVDVWPVGAPGPRRVDFFDDEIEQLKQIDPRSGRSVRKLQRVVILPAREERIDTDSISRLQDMLAAAVSDEGRGQALRRRIVEELRAGIRFSGLEDLLPGLVEVEDPLDALGALPVIAVHPGAIGASARDFGETVARRWRDMDQEERPLITPEQRFVATDTLLAAVERAHPV